MPPRNADGSTLIVEDMSTDGSEEGIASQSFTLRAGDYQAFIDAVPYARFLGLTAGEEGVGASYLDYEEMLDRERPDAVYIALHGKYGEDGTIQELLEFLGIPYTGPGVVACALSWDKSVTKHRLAEKDIPTPSWITLTADAFKEMGAATALDLVPGVVGEFPLAVKPAEQGSGLGLAKVESAEALPEALLAALSYGDKALVEKWVDGTVVAVSVLDGPDGPKALPPVEIVAPPMPSVSPVNPHSTSVVAVIPMKPECPV